MTTSPSWRPHITPVDAELDRLVNVEGVDQVKACQRLFAPDVAFDALRPAAAERAVPTGAQVLEFVDEVGDFELTPFQRVYLNAIYDGPPAPPIYPPAGRWDFRAVLRWLTGGRRP